MQKDTIIKKSKISGKGVFALRDFKKGEVVLKWSPKSIIKDHIEKMSTSKKKYILQVGRKYFLMQAPEKYVNYSCEPNTNTKNLCDIAVRNIKKGEEIASNYGGESQDDFLCKCGSKKCKKSAKLG